MEFSIIFLFFLNEGFPNSTTRSSRVKSGSYLLNFSAAHLAPVDSVTLHPAVLLLHIRALLLGNLSAGSPDL